MKKNIFIITIIAFLIQGCSKNFLNRPPQDATTSGNFYTTDAEIASGTASLYGILWFNYNGQALLSFGSAHGGDLNCDDADRLAYTRFAIPSTDGILLDGYKGFWNLVAQTNVIMSNIKGAINSKASQTAINRGLAECRFMRGMAYYYLVSNWGAVPIMYDNIAQLGDSTIQRNDIASVWQFIIRDFLYAADKLETTPAQQGRITKWTAEAMLAKSYLYRSGLGKSEGSRSQTDLDSAKYYAKNVCEESGLSLLPSYYNLFTHAYNSTAFANPNPESLFSLLWLPNNSPWGINNSYQAFVAFTTDITQTGDGWGAEFGASANLLKYFLDPVNAADSLRRRATFMLPGDFYPELNAKNGGTLLKESYFGRWSDHAYIKKYVIGSPDDNGGGVFMAAYENTYMLRLAEVYLIYAEAILGNSSSTSDATALKYFNAVRTRAGIPNKAAITFNDIFQEKRIEFALEGLNWYDWLHWYYFAPEKAKSYFSNQDRGRYTFTKTTPPFDLNSVTFYEDGNYNVTETNLYLPWPETEIIAHPNLAKDPVPFDFSKLKD